MQIPSASDSTRCAASCANFALVVTSARRARRAKRAKEMLPTSQERRRDIKGGALG
jgi:hypothetical protein